MTASKVPHCILLMRDLSGGETTVPMTENCLTIGKSAGNDLVISNDPFLSRTHCKILYEDGKLYLEDCGSRNGTLVDGELVAGRVELPMGAAIMAGRSRLFVQGPEDTSTDSPLMQTMTICRSDALQLPGSDSKEIVCGLFVVDIVGSTKLLGKLGEQGFGKVVERVGRLIEDFLADDLAGFLQCTGDGYLGLLSKTHGLLGLFCDIQNDINTGSDHPVRLSVALHWGNVILKKETSALGKHVHAVFALEKLRKQEDQARHVNRLHDTLPIVLATEDFLLRMPPEDRLSFAPTGSARLDPLETESRISIYGGPGRVQ